MTTPELIGVGSPLVDLVLNVDDDFLAANVPGAKGGMEMVEAETISELVSAAPVEPVRAAGGAAANTIVGASALGITTAFIGSCGQDDEAGFYRSALVTDGCEDRLIATDQSPTGRVLCLITPDGERTMRTHLGAAGHLAPSSVTPALFEGARIAMLEGYLCFDHALTRAVVSAAHEAGCKVALDLASLEVVGANRDLLIELMDSGIDLVFANEDEALAWSADGIEAALDDLAARCSVAVVKMGAEGAWIASHGERLHVAADPVEQVVDTVGAGDSWAAGFLAGYLRGLPPEACGRLGALAGAAAVQTVGARLPHETWLGLRGRLDAWA